jgi:tetratricopeptide (TPR) repeat protein
MSICCFEKPSPACTGALGAMLRVLLAVLMVAALTTVSVMRNARWHTLLSMWEDCARKSPNKSRTHNNLGNCYLLLGQHFSALAEYQKAVALEPGNLEAQYNLATTSDAVGMHNLALRHYDVFCRLATSQFGEQRARACARVEDLVAAARASGGASQ